MKPRVSARYSFLTFGLLLALGAPDTRAASPEPAPLVALHPCVILGEKSKDKVQEAQALCAAEFSPHLPLVPPEQVQAFLDKEPKKACGGKKASECLGRLATATQATRALLITLQPGALTQASGLVVDAQGTLIDEKRIQIRSRGQPQEQLLLKALTSLRGQLRLDLPKAPAPVEPSPPVAVAPTPPPAPAPPPAPPPAPAPSTADAPRTDLVLEATRPAAAPRTWKTPVAYGAAGAGVVAWGLAGYFALSAEKAVVASNEVYAGRYPYASELPRLNALRAQAHSQRVIAGVSTAAGAVLAGAGVYLWLADRHHVPWPGVAALSAGPGGVSLLGTLP